MLCLIKFISFFVSFSYFLEKGGQATVQGLLSVPLGLITIKGLEDVYRSLWKPVSVLQSITCHMGSHSLTCHSTHVNALHP